MSSFFFLLIYYPGQKKRKNEPCCWCIKSESCDIEESWSLIQLRNRERTRLATSRIDALQRNPAADSSVSHDASPGWFFFFLARVVVWVRTMENVKWWMATDWVLIVEWWEHKRNWNLKHAKVVRKQCYRRGVRISSCEDSDFQKVRPLSCWKIGHPPSGQS